VTSPRRRPSALVLAWACACACAVVPVSLAGSSVDPGVTATSIRLGTTAPLTGAASGQTAVARGAKAYFDLVNARGGVAGRRIELAVADDAGDPEQTRAATRELVQDGVFAVVSPIGTEQSLAARAYLNEARVPHLFVGSGAAAWAAERARFPWSLGFQPSSRAEGLIFGRYLAATRPRAKVAVLLRRGDVDGVEELAGLRRGLGRAGSVVAVESYLDTETSVQPRLARLKESGATVLAVLAAPAVATKAYADLRRLRWKPHVLVSASAAAGKGAPAGSLAFAFLKSPTDPRWKDDPGMRIYRAALARFAAGANARDPLHVHGMAVAFETVSLLRRLGTSPTRAGLMARARSIRSAGNPFLLPGVAVRTSRADAFPVQQGRLVRWQSGRWRPFGGLWSS
jgi:branched-chain amino acid transport system substrate-binding protein